MINNAQRSELRAFSEQLADASRAILTVAAEEMPSVTIKDDQSPVTETDKAVEARMREMLAETYPDHGILGEEFDNHNLDAEFVWVLDPIDGTNPFIAGIPVYGTLIGLAYQGRPWMGVIDHPATGDRWFGFADQGAWRNGKAVKTRPCTDISNALISNSNPDYFTAEETAFFAGLRDNARQVVYGGSCFSYGLLASGRVDLAIDSGFDPFDIFAPAAVIEGAGGSVSTWDGGAIDLDFHGQVIAFGDNALRDAVLGD